MIPPDITVKAITKRYVEELKTKDLYFGKVTENLAEIYGFRIYNQIVEMDKVRDHFDESGDKEFWDEIRKAAI